MKTATRVLFLLKELNRARRAGLDYVAKGIERKVEAGDRIRGRRGHRKKEPRRG